MAENLGRVVIVGAGHAGGSVAALLRQYGWHGPITLIGAEAVAPYQRPPLSKAWLHGGIELSALLLRPADFYAANGIELIAPAEAVAIDRGAHTVALSNGQRIAYDRLVLALGSYARALPVPGCDLGGIVSLRTLADAERLGSLLCPGARIAIIGAGYIGLEVAASAQSLGADVTVIEREPRVLARVASAPIAAFFHRHHAAAGVRILLDATVAAFEGQRGHVSAVVLAGAESVPCDAVLVGIGAAPNVALAENAGLACDGGIMVDATARTSDPAICAIGDCTRRPLPLYERSMRLESVPNALEQAKQAAADLCGRPPPAPEVPWFWSDQYEARLQIAGLPFDVTQLVVRGDPMSAPFAVFHLSVDGTVQAVEAINAPADFMAGRLMIARRGQVDAGRLGDALVPLRELVAG